MQPEATIQIPRPAEYLSSKGIGKDFEKDLKENAKAILSEVAIERERNV
jgi:hypothetical protein